MKSILEVGKLACRVDIGDTRELVLVCRKMFLVHTEHLMVSDTLCN